MATEKREFFFESLRGRCDTYGRKQSEHIKIDGVPMVLGGSTFSESTSRDYLPQIIAQLFENPEHARATEPGRSPKTCCTVVYTPPPVPCVPRSGGHEKRPAAARRGKLADAEKTCVSYVHMSQYMRESCPRARKANPCRTRDCAAHFLGTRGA